MKRRARKLLEKKVTMASPGRKPGKALGEELMKKAYCFNSLDDTSRVIARERKLCCCLRKQRKKADLKSLYSV